ncbi:MAG: MarR family transcriptional regulator [Acidobacteria bacterium]|nr:MarR family transcriptional regulator [Acidobacteriota bacterium]
MAAGPSPAIRSAPPSDAVLAVRRFNRFYTRQIGVLQKRLLQSPFSLTEVRVLYELAHQKGLTAAELRNDLGLDRGYLSRMLQRFHSQGWIRSVRSSKDRRSIVLSLTVRGRKVFAPLEKKSSEEVAGMLRSMAPLEQKKLLGALCDIERLLSPGTATKQAWTIRGHRPGDMGWVVHRHGTLYWEEYGYDERFEALVARIAADFINRLDARRERCWLAELNAEVAGSVFLVKKSEKVAKLRLLLVEPSARGLGIGKRLVAECVDFARSAGYRKIVLWTQSELHAARHLYEQAGFRLAGRKPHQSWGRSDLVAENWELKL